MFYKDSSQIYRVPELDRFEWLVHGFGTRHADVPALFPNLALLKQIHSSDCVAAEGRSGILGEGDALLEDRPGAVVAVKTADCIPLLLVDERRRAVAAVHAGWRGTAAGIAARAVEEMRARFGTVPADLHAAIGPGIGKCCYEVGPEVAARFGAEVTHGGADLPVCLAVQDAAEARTKAGQEARPTGGRAHIDLTAANRLRLIEAGVTAERIYASNLCTMCAPADFHSFRRDREAAGRMHAFAGIR